jgi:hypothetical protein
MIMVRWADDFVVGFQYRHTAETFKMELATRLTKFSLTLHPEKTKSIEFGPYAIENAMKKGRSRPDPFNFLGFTHTCGKKRSNGMFTIIRKTIKKKMRAKLKEIKVELRKRMHQSVPETGKWLKTVIEGHQRYYGVPMNWSRLNCFRFQVIGYWYNALNRRSQKQSVNWERMRRYEKHFIPPTKIHHPYPLKRFGVITRSKSPVR